jgi:formylglycine-generating enzyme required for sulfatase activity/dienelactone hydrolase
VEEARVPLGPYWLRIEKDGFETIDGFYRGLGTYDSPEVAQELEFSLAEGGSIPPDMVRIPASSAWMNLIGLPGESPHLDTYFIDKHEVTNREFKAFVDAGGYQKPEHWEHEFLADGRALTFGEAMAEFRDRTGRPGPSTWEVGTYPEGHDDYPVSGVSWYEAAAFARFVGKRLPTIYHWVGGTNTYLAPFVVPLSNFSNRGPRPVASALVGPRGTFDMAGNVKEWCWNAAQDRRFILGGGWNEPSYMYYEVDAQSPFARLGTYGFRCAQYLDSGDGALDELTRPIRLPAQRLRAEEPVSDEVFDAYTSQYAYDDTDLRAEVESVDNSSPHWTRERITFDAAYDQDRVIAYLFVPRNAAPPFQTVVYFPGSSALRHRSINEMQLRIVDFIIKSGRAVMYPIYRNTHERIEGRESVDTNTRAYVVHVTYWINDLRRSVDYLETRDDIDTAKLAYYGFSWGGALGPVALALEKRLDLGILLDGGLGPPGRPEAEPLNFAPRVGVPVLMVNGTMDATFPVETSSKPLFDSLGTPEENKRHVLFECGHATLSFHRNQGIREILNWLDHYFGRPSHATPADPPTS